MLIPLVVGGAIALTFVFVRLGQGRLATTDGEGVRFGGFNALRAFAALGVVAGHTTITSPIGGLPRFFVDNLATGVALFFVISGFLLYRPFAACLQDRAKVSIRRFAGNRALRIVPLYFVVVVVVFAATTGHPALSVLRLVRALSFTGVYFGDDLVPVAWSLDDEVAFYLLLPVLYLAVMAWPRPQERIWVAAAVIGVLSVLSLVALALSPGDQAIAGGPLTKFHLFGFGMLLGTLHAQWHRYTLRSTHVLFAALGMTAALAISTVAYEQRLYIFNPACGLAFFGLVGMVAFSGPASRLTKALSWRPLVHLGDVSYGVYLWHEPLHHVLFNSGLLGSGYVAGFLLLACCTVALATGTYYLIEKPALRIKNRWAVPRAATAPRPAAAAIPVGANTV
jgi:peptidoglycan/LPS O-acetylase OafA/YrhL